MFLFFPVSGIFKVFVLINILPEIFERLVCELNITLGDDDFVDYALNNVCTNLFRVVQALAMLVSPLIGGYLYTVFNDHRRVASVFIYVDLAVFALLFLFNGDFRVFQENRNFLKKLY